MGQEWRPVGGYGCDGQWACGGLTLASDAAGMPCTLPTAAYLCEELVTLQQLHLGLQLSDVGGRGICNTRGHIHRQTRSPVGELPSPHSRREKVRGPLASSSWADSFSLCNALGPEQYSQTPLTGPSQPRAAYPRALGPGGETETPEQGNSASGAVCCTIPDAQNSTSDLWGGHTGR